VRIVTAIFFGFLLSVGAVAQEVATPRVFRVKYVAEGVVYLNGGRNSGLSENEILKVSPPGTDEGSSRGEQLAAEEVAVVKVLSLADASAVCEVLSSHRPIEAGDVALLPAGTPTTPARNTAERPYLQVVSFTSEGEENPLEAEKRAEVPRLHQPEVNRKRGRIGVEYTTLVAHGESPSRSSEMGLVVRADMTRIGGTYWNFNGYWRGRLNQNSGTQTQSVSDLLNRTYQLSLTYNNPFSSHLIGVGRLYLPWASSVDILDGGYAGLRSANGTVVGIFGGTTPDPTSWNYSPNRKQGGAFFAIERGDFQHIHMLSTSGVAASMIGWVAERQFAFAENTISYRRLFNVFQSIQIDAPHDYVAANPTSPSTPVVTHYSGIDRSYVTLRLQPFDRLSFDLSHSYFRGVPTFDPTLIGTGLLDRYLFQGLSGGVRADVVKSVSIYTNIGRSSRSSDAQASWNQLYGVTLANLLHTSLRADARYSKFDSSFGQGSYESVSLSRQLRESLRVEFQGGIQTLASTALLSSSTHFVTSSVDWSPGRHFFLQSFFTWQRGGLTNYDQVSVIAGERF
jgi:hypothetical protein